MSKYNGLVVAFERDVSEEECDQLKKAICSLRLVLNATPNISDMDVWIAEERVRRELGNKLLRVIYGTDMYTKG